MISSEDGQNHMHELSKLAEKDPEFFKYLQENDRELLDFDADGIPDADDDDDIAGDGDVAMEEEDRLPTLTNDVIRKWQRSLLEVCCFSRRT